MFRRVPLLTILLVAAPWAALAAPPHAQAAQPIPTVDLFLRAISNDQAAAEVALAQIAAGWRNGYAGRIIDQAAMMQLRSVRDPKLVLARVAAHRAFWFGWFAQHPDTLLIK